MIATAANRIKHFINISCFDLINNSEVVPVIQMRGCSRRRHGTYPRPASNKWQSQDSSREEDQLCSVISSGVLGPWGVE